VASLLTNGSFEQGASAPGTGWSTAGALTATPAFSPVSYTDGTRSLEVTMSPGGGQAGSAYDVTQRVKTGFAVGEVLAVRADRFFVSRSTIDFSVTMKVEARDEADVNLSDLFTATASSLDPNWTVVSGESLAIPPSTVSLVVVLRHNNGDAVSGSAVCRWDNMTVMVIPSRRRVTPLSEVAAGRAYDVAFLADDDAGPVGYSLVRNKDNQLAYFQEEAPVFGDPRAQADSSASDFSLWRSSSQQDFSGGMGQLRAATDEEGVKKSLILENIRITDTGQIGPGPKPTTQALPSYPEPATTPGVRYASTTDASGAAQRFLAVGRTVLVWTQAGGWQTAATFSNPVVDLIAFANVVYASFGNQEVMQATEPHGATFSQLSNLFPNPSFERGDEPPGDGWTRAKRLTGERELVSWPWSAEQAIKVTVTPREGEAGGEYTVVVPATASGFVGERLSLRYWRLFESRSSIDFSAQLTVSAYDSNGKFLADLYDSGPTAAVDNDWVMQDVKTSPIPPSTDKVKVRLRHTNNVAVSGQAVCRWGGLVLRRENLFDEHSFESAGVIGTAWFPDTDNNKDMTGAISAELRMVYDGRQALRVKATGTAANGQYWIIQRITRGFVVGAGLELRFARNFQDRTDGNGSVRARLDAYNQAGTATNLCDTALDGPDGGWNAFSFNTGNIPAGTLSIIMRLEHYNGATATGFVTCLWDDFYLGRDPANMLSASVFASGGYTIEGAPNATLAFETIDGSQALRVNVTPTANQPGHVYVLEAVGSALPIAPGQQLAVSASRFYRVKPLVGLPTIRLVVRAYGADDAVLSTLLTLSTTALDGAMTTISGTTAALPDGVVAVRVALEHEVQASNLDDFEVLWDRIRVTPPASAERPGEKAGPLGVGEGFLVRVSPDDDGRLTVLDHSPTGEAWSFVDEQRFADNQVDATGSAHAFYQGQFVFGAADGLYTWSGAGGVEAVTQQLGFSTATDTRNVRRLEVWRGKVYFTVGSDALYAFDGTKTPERINDPWSTTLIGPTGLLSDGEIAWMDLAATAWHLYVAVAVTTAGGAKRSYLYAFDGDGWSIVRTFEGTWVQLAVYGDAQSVFAVPSPQPAPGAPVVYVIPAGRALVAAEEERSDSTHQARFRSSRLDFERPLVPKLVSSVILRADDLSAAITSTLDQDAIKTDTALVLAPGVDMNQWQVGDWVWIEPGEDAAEVRYVAAVNAGTRTLTFGTPAGYDVDDALETTHQAGADIVRLSILASIFDVDTGAHTPIGGLYDPDESVQTIRLPPGSPVVTQNFELRLSWLGTTNVPAGGVLTEWGIRYVFAPDVKRRWRLSLNLRHGAQRLDSSPEPRSVAEMVDDLWTIKGARRLIRFYDIDGRDYLGRLGQLEIRYEDIVLESTGAVVTAGVATCFVLETDSEFIGGQAA
jgi:hypothetical protein